MSLIQNIELYKTHSLKAVNRNVVVKYTNTDIILEKKAPITPTSRLNMSESEMKVYTDTFGEDSFNPNWTFEEAVNTEIFKTILISRLQNSSMHQTCVVDNVSDKMKDEWGYLEGKNLYLSQNIVGAIQHFTEGCKEFYATFTIPEKFNSFNFPFMAYSKNQKFIPVKGFVEVCFEIPQELSFKEIEGMRIKGNLIPSKFQDPAEIGLQEFREIAREQGDMFMNANTAKVTSVSEIDPQFKEDDIVFLKPSWRFTMDKVHRIEFDKGLLYYFVPEDEVLNKIIEIND